MAKPLPPPGADSSLKERAPPTSMITTLPPRSKMATPPRRSALLPKTPAHYCSDWDQFYQLLLQFKQREGHFTVPVHHLESGKQLGFWLMIQHIHHKRGTMNQDRKHILESLSLDWNPQVSLWEFNFLMFLQFRDREGHLRVPARHVEDGQKLGCWICSNRSQKTKGTLAPEKERRLNEIGFIWKGREGNWDTMYRSLIQFKQREGHCNVSVKHIEHLHLEGAVNLKLGAWLKNQRYIEKLDAKKAELLESLGVSRNPPGASSPKNSNPYYSDWDQCFMLLVQFKEREGHCSVPIHHLESGKKIGFWLMVQNLHRKRDTMDRDRRHLLQNLGVDWNPSVSTWDFNVLLLLQFRDREGHVRVPIHHVEDGHKLGIWISMNRLQKRNGIILPERERRLNEIGFIWRGRERKYDIMCRALTQFKQREGHCNVSDKQIEYLDGGVKYNLGAWLMSQREFEGNGKLDAKKTEMLESLGVKWCWNAKRQAISEEMFDWQFNLLLAFKEREGHVRVPLKHQESANDNLGLWLSSQRSAHRYGILELDRQKWLEVAGVKWESWKQLPELKNLQPF
jgi:hypothetical protein